jgi:hypothetical protein
MRCAAEAAVSRGTPPGVFERAYRPHARQQHQHQHQLGASLAPARRSTHLNQRRMFGCCCTRLINSWGSLLWFTQAHLQGSGKQDQAQSGRNQLSIQSYDA